MKTLITRLTRSEPRLFPFSPPPSTHPCLSPFLSPSFSLHPSLYSSSTNLSSSLNSSASAGLNIATMERAWVYLIRGVSEVPIIRLCDCQWGGGAPASRRCRQISKLVSHVILSEMRITRRKLVGLKSFVSEMTPSYHQALQSSFLPLPHFLYFIFPSFPFCVFGIYLPTFFYTPNLFWHLLFRLSLELFRLSASLWIWIFLLLLCYPSEKQNNFFM